jgi:hypothetical protein
MRWLHIYLSMFGLAIVLFFSVTGLTLNHPTWFFGQTERRVQTNGRLKLKWLHLNTRENQSDRSANVAKLEVVEYLRKAHRLRGALTEFRVDEHECLVSFKGPAYSADAFVDRDSGHYQVTQSSHGLIAVVNDLHKGRDAGPAWSLLIDMSAVLMTLISLTGLILLCYLKLRRKTGLVVILAGTAVVVGLYLLGVP